MTCAALWDRLPAGRTTITEDDVRSFGDVDHALRTLYDDAMRVAATEAGIEEKRLRDDFAKAFLTVMGTRGTAYRSDEGVGGMPWPAINVLESRHVIRAEWRARAHWYELTHDRFIGPIVRSNRRFVLREMTGLHAKGRAAPVLLEPRGGLAGLAGRRRAVEATVGDAPDEAEEDVGAGVALCVTGSGFRSMLFTAGVLWRLNDAGYLPRLDQLSSNSTAALAAALLGLRWSELEFDSGGRSPRFYELVVEPLHRLADRTLDLRAAWASVVRQSGGNAVLAEQLAKRLFGDATLQSLPDAPRFLFTASHLSSGQLWRFGKDRMGNVRAGWTESPQLPIATAVAASNAVPPLLSPAVLDDESTGRIALTSGSLYDTLALETAWRRYDTVLVSDGKGPRAVAHAERRRLSHFFDFVDASGTELHRLRRQQALLAYTTGIKRGGYWSINSHLASFPVGDVLHCPPRATAELAGVPGRLNRLEPRLQERLVNWGYAVSDAAMRAHVDHRLEPAKEFPYGSAGVG